MIMMAKEKYNSLMESCRDTKNKHHEQAIDNDDVSTQSDGDSNLDNAPCHANAPAFCDIIQYTVPKKMQRKAYGLMQFLLQYGGDVIKWNQRGQIIVNGETIEGTHLIDLLRDTVCPKTVHRPVRFEKFYQALKTIDTPRSFIANARYTDVHPRTQTLSQTGDRYVMKKQTNGPPPGYSPPKKVNKIETKWLKF